jgi:hypothetical protein
LVIARKKDIYLVLTQNISLSPILSHSRFLGKIFLSVLSLLPRLYLSSPLRQSSKTYSSQRLSLCYGTSKIYEQVEASIELILSTLSSQGKNHEIRVLVKEALGWNRDE